MLYSRNLDMTSIDQTLQMTWIRSGRTSVIPATGIAKYQRYSEQSAWYSGT